jgi:hypothetical protein
VTKTSKHQIIDRIQQDWGEKPQFKICVSILEYLICLNTSNPLHLTFGGLRNSAGLKFSDSEFLLAIQYLCGDRTHLLDIGFELIEGGEYIEIPDCELNNARQTGFLVHPETGEVINDFEDKVYMYFQPSSLIRSLL